MLRIRFRDGDNSVTMRLEGRLVGCFAEDLRGMLTRCPIPTKLVVDLSEVTFVDAIGEQVLSWLAQTGAQFIAESAYGYHLCELLHLSLMRKGERVRPTRRVLAMSGAGGATTSVH